ncbi:hypothetical protein C5B86_20255 [Haloferax sp. Atlit-19N]|nr:hypothetical protein C5B86_20255 [Haloferax sp. Atlit-19N]
MFLLLNHLDMLLSLEYLLLFLVLRPPVALLILSHLDLLLLSIPLVLDLLESQSSFLVVSLYLLFAEYLLFDLVSFFHLHILVYYLAHHLE